ncbi:MAG: valine--tRNA ligase, partial [Parachlamydiales bacterium]
MAELSSAYNPKEIEDKWYRFWQEKNFFKADPGSSKKAFSIVIPPPNVTGALHMGHALDETLQDILCRFKRMLGFEVLWVPGTDHAGISTQTVVEKHLIKTLGKRRTDFTREEFLKEVWAWKEEKQHSILGQIAKMGSSCDWSRLRFTLDEQCSLAVKTVFQKMFNDGLIYRGDYLVNWDPVTQTAIADDEVEWEEKAGSLWYFRYPLKTGQGLNENQKFIVIATTRPETMLGDTAIAVSPEDPRYQGLIGKTVLLPFVNREIPIIADSFVDPKFGSGAVKITPAHDFNDHAVAGRHSLPLINIMNPNGTINQNGAEFEGLKMTEARALLVQKMQEKGLLEKIEPYRLNLGVSYRSKAAVEPYLSKQWFVKMTAFKEVLKNTVLEKKVRLVPENWEETYFHWIDNLRDWCISRQLWWGHRIPIWYNLKDPDKILCYTGPGEPKQVKKHPENWKQEEDVLDTWFSSALWPFSTMGWPKKTAEMKKFYPTSILVTGHDILFFWIARMILMSQYVLKKVPFRQTFIHGLIYGKSYWRKDPDGSVTYAGIEEKSQYDLGAPIPSDVSFKWEKMSKSKGNVIDPLAIIEKYGTDAMRLALSASATHASQIDLDLRRFEEYKNFTNKLWNGSRFVLQNTSSLGQEALEQGLKTDLFNLEDHWILGKLNQTIQKETLHLEKCEFDKATLVLYDFFWNDFCAYYLELAKPVLFGKELNFQIAE